MSDLLQHPNGDSTDGETVVLLALDLTVEVSPEEMEQGIETLRNLKVIGMSRGHVSLAVPGQLRNLN